MAAEDDLDSLIGRIPACTSHSLRTPDLRCCCGRTDCAYLRHNCLALDDLEKEVRTAAQLGQALLVRHEQYMQDAERDRNEMTAKIEKLGADKKELETQNSKTIEENHDLLDQLESVNGTLAESEIHVKSLEETLHTTRQELRRLEGLASRTRDLEAQMAQLELEQELLQKTVATTQEEERCAVQRWRKAERSLINLHDQLERIEREAREEREKHVEVLGRMERQRAVERELDTAAGRLKGAAAATANGKHGSSVVSHFVKDILQDNVNLQMGIVELREMLMNSNDEVQMLREQLLMHQPVVESKVDGSAPSTLRAELGPEEPAETKEEKSMPHVVSQALHIHHHYHAPKKDEIRRPKKKRTSLNTALFTPPRHMQSPRTSRDVASAILSQTSVTVPSPITPTNRWSVQSGQMSDFAPSSVPSSPQSYRNSNLFDRGYDFDSSRPTSPGSSVDPMSPQFQPQCHKKRGSDVSGRNFATPINFQSHVIHEEEDSDVEKFPDLQAPSIPSLDDGTTPSDVSHESESDTQDHQWSTSFQPSLRRTSSHESILSISGLDIHTLKSRPSQMTITGDSLHSRPRTRFGTPSSIVSVETMTSASMITARPTLSRQGHNSTSYLRSQVLANSDARSISSSGSNENSHPRTGGWLFSRWGVSPAKSIANLRGPPPAAPSQQRVVSAPVDPLRAFMGRPPGINQKGPIPGFIKKAEKAPSKVTTELVDHDALQEVLMED